MVCTICGSIQNGKLRKGDCSYVRCRGFGLLSSDPIPSAHQIDEQYRAKFQTGNYETARRYAAQYRRIHQQLADWILPRHGERILDVGCFTGELTGLLSSRRADAYGLELQQKPSRSHSNDCRATCFKPMWKGSTFPVGSYDTITMMAVIEHVTDSGRFIRRAHSLLVPGGRLMPETPDAGGMLAYATRSHWPPLAPVDLIPLFSRPAIRKLLHSCGFSGVQCRAYIKPVGYMYEMLANFGPEWQRLFRPVHAVLGGAGLPFYVGEVLVSAVRQ